MYGYVTRVIIIVPLFDNVHVVSAELCLGLWYFRFFFKSHDFRRRLQKKLLVSLNWIGGERSLCPFVRRRKQFFLPLSSFSFESRLFIPMKRGHFFGFVLHLVGHDFGLITDRASLSVCLSVWVACSTTDVYSICSSRSVGRSRFDKFSRKFERCQDMHVRTYLCILWDKYVRVNRAAACQLGNSSSRAITEVKQRELD